MKITYLGHSCFGVETGGKRLLFDPFVSSNPLAQNLDVQGFVVDYILPSHAHSDHISDLETVAKNNPNAVVIAIADIAERYAHKGLKTHGMNKGGWASFDFGRVKMVAADHSSTFPDGKSGGESVGFVLDTPEGVLYFAGDTALTMDMQLIPMTCPELDIAILPIGDNYTMGPADAVIASDFVRCNRVVGCHFDTFPQIKIDHEKAVAAFSEKGKELILMQIGETLDV